MTTCGTRRAPCDPASGSEDRAPARQGVPMNVFTTTLTIASREKEEIRNLTDQLDSIPALQQISHGFVLIHSLHTTVVSA